MVNFADFDLEFHLWYIRYGEVQGYLVCSKVICKVAKWADHYWPRVAMAQLLRNCVAFAHRLLIAHADSYWLH